MRRAVPWMLALALIACGGEEETATPTEPEPTAPEPEPEPEPEPVDRWPNEACARVIVVSYRGAMAAADDVTRSEEEARALAGELRVTASGEGADFETLARENSDAAASGPRGGLLGTYTRESFPAIHEPIRDPVFELEVGDVSEVLTAPYGFVIAQRCEVEKIHTRHILVRFEGARNADDVTRTREEARARAEELRGQVTADGADFAAIARAESEDSSAEDGGDLGMVGRGLLAVEYEEAAWQLDENEISRVVETTFGYHVIQRLPDAEE